MRIDAFEATLVWQQAVAITSIAFTLANGTKLLQGSEFTLYGMQ